MNTSLMRSTQKQDINDAIVIWIDHKANSPRTAESYRETLEDFRALLLAAGVDLDGDPKVVTTALQGWSKGSKTGRVVKPATIAQRLGVIRSFYRFVIRRALVATIQTNPGELLDAPAVQAYADVQPVAVAVIKDAFRSMQRSDFIDDRRDLVLLRVALTTGRRCSELANSDLADMTIDAGRVTITWRCKGGKTMRDTLAQDVGRDLLAFLNDWYQGNIPSSGALFPQVRGKTAGHPLQAAGIAKIVKRRLNAHPHQLRHTFAVVLEKAGAEVSEIQARLGHESLDTTSRYLKAITLPENPFSDSLAKVFSSAD